jgi:hypothetical protein
MHYLHCRDSALPTDSADGPLAVFCGRFLTAVDSVVKVKTRKELGLSQSWGYDEMLMKMAPSKILL